jgi:signal transduction histidine kinase
MLNCCDTLKRHPQEPELLERYLPLLETGLNRIRQIVRGLLVEIRTEGAYEPCGPECMEELKELIEAEVGDRDVTFQWENRLPADVRINRPPVQQIVFNLLKNAVQAVPDGGTVTFRAYRNGEGVLFEVSDDGPGIAEANRDRLFDPFFTTKASGTGLGLWIVYRLVESLHGVIRIESEPGRGTWFQICVPVAEEEQARWAN